MNATYSTHYIVSDDAKKSMSHLISCSLYSLTLSAVSPDQIGSELTHYKRLVNMTELAGGHQL